MCARSASLACLLLLVWPGSLAHAKKSTFLAGSPFGLTMRAGLSPAPSSDFLTNPQPSHERYTPFYGFEPFLDFGNFALAASAQLHSFPLVTHANALYSESSDVYTVLLGGHLRLVPYLSEDATHRIYLKLAFSQATAYGENTRTYQTGAIYTEKFEGESRELLFGVGWEFFLVQNYSLQIEAGARQLEFGRLEYTGGTDLTGAPRAKGTPLRNANFTNKKINYTGGYGSLGLSLNF